MPEELSGQFAPPRAREVLLGAGDPGAFLNLGRQQAGSISGATPSANQIFGFAIVDLLKQFQQFGQQKLGQAQQEQVQRGLAPLPSDLAGAQLSPSQILGFRKGEVGAVEPSVGAAKGLIGEAKNTIDSYLELLRREQDREFKEKQLDLEERRFGLEKQKAALTESTKSQAASALKVNALESAQGLLEKFKTTKYAVGKSSFLPVLPGSKASDFVVQFNNLKSLLSLDNVKYLKGQGQVSDAERKLLEQASARLDRSQSEKEFGKSLNDIIKALGGLDGNQTSGTTTRVRGPGGTFDIPTNQLDIFKQNGYQQI